MLPSLLLIFLIKRMFVLLYLVYFAFAAYVDFSTSLDKKEIVKFDNLVFKEPFWYNHFLVNWNSKWLSSNTVLHWQVLLRQITHQHFSYRLHRPKNIQIPYLTACIKNIKSVKNLFKVSLCYRLQSNKSDAMLPSTQNR